MKNFWKIFFKGLFWGMDRGKKMEPLEWLGFPELFFPYGVIEWPHKKPWPRYPYPYGPVYKKWGLSTYLTASIVTRFKIPIGIFLNDWTEFYPIGRILNFRDKLHLPRWSMINLNCPYCNKIFLICTEDYEYSCPYCDMWFE